MNAANRVNSRAAKSPIVAYFPVTWRQEQAVSERVGETSKPFERAKPQADHEARRLKRQEDEAFDNARRKQSVSSVSFDTIAFTFTAHNKCLVVTGNI